MAITVSRPSGRRADDVRALRFRFRNIAFSGNYATGGEVITARSVGLKRILMVVPGAIAVGDPATPANGYTLPTFTISTDGTQVTVRQLEDVAGASGTPFGLEKTNAEAYVAASAMPVFFVGE